ncbi:MAG: GNAT family N-acetyltransferase [Candidatus Saliniplasma sp.]
MIMYKIKEFGEDHIPEAVDLFVKSYKKQRENFSLIPEKDDLYEVVYSKLSDKSDNPGVVAVDGDRLMGYMIETGTSDDFMGERTAFSLGLYSHSSLGTDKKDIYQKMYAELAEKWVDNGYYSHIFSFWAQDYVLSYQFFRLGFGMTHFELMRDLSYVKEKDFDINISKLDNMTELKDLHKNELRYYKQAPLFWIIEEDGFEENVEGTLIAAFDNEELVGYMHLKINESETSLLADEKIGRIAGAYVNEEYRREGIGVGLLNKAVGWAENSNLKCLYVEGESANIQGGNFWVKHFTPIVYTVRRCVDERI